VTKKERFAKGFAALEAMPVTCGVPFQDVVASLRNAGALELDVEQWEHNVAWSILEGYNRTSEYPILLKPKGKTAGK
jgi:hypothetical protein